MREKVFFFLIPKLSKPSKVTEHFTPGNELQYHVQIAIVLQHELYAYDFCYFD